MNNLAQIFPAISPYLEFIISKPSLTSKERLAAFVSQLAVESQNFTRMEENLNYSAAGLLKTFPKYYKTFLEASLDVGKKEVIANKVYGSRMGNNGQGYLFRGRGPIQITGHDNYLLLAKYWNCSLEECLVKIVTPSGAIDSAYWYWTTHNCDTLADIEDIDKISDLINIGRKTVAIGDANAYKERVLMYKKVKECL